jgi:hypothetical protein
MSITAAEEYAAIAAELGLGPEHASFADDLAASRAWRDATIAITAAQLERACALLAVPDEARPAVARALEACERSPGLARLLHHCRWRFYGAAAAPASGNSSEPSLLSPYAYAWPALPENLGDAGRLFHLLIPLAGVDRIRARHAAWGVSDAISRATLADVGRQVAIHRRMHGTWGFDEIAWSWLHLEGHLFELGRLQFLRSILWYPLTPEARASCPLSPLEPVLDVHVPEGAPLEPALVDESIARARDFFARHFPESRYRAVTLLSWLLAPELADHLPADSNVLRFQHRFTPLPLVDPVPGSVFKFVFRHASEAPDAAALAALPQRTRLERAIVAHVRAGGLWRAHAGYFLL